MEQHHSEPTGEGPGAPSVDASVDGDPLIEVRAQLDDVVQRPVDERADVFDRAHRVVMEELRALDRG